MNVHRFSISAATSVSHRPGAPSARLLAALVAALVTLGLSPSAFSQASACYKGQCVGLNTTARGTNFGAIEAASALHWPLVAAGTSGGAIDVSYLDATSSGRCVGFATALPDHTITLDVPAVLAFEVNAARDTALLIHGPGGWRCNDDSHGQNPVISDAWSAGEYRVWVASYNGGFHDYELRVEVVAPDRDGRGPGRHPGHGHGDADDHDGRRPPPPTPGRRPRGLDATSTVSEFGDITFRAGDRAAVLTGTSGGSRSIAPLRGAAGESCVGYADSDPDHIVTLTDSFELQIAATAAQDSTLAIHGPQGWICNNDYDGFHPSVSGVFAPGTYRVWIGSFEPRRAAAYRLAITDLSTPVVRPPPVPLTFSFEGRFGELDVFFVGETISDLFEECRAFAATSDSLDWIDEATIGGRTYHNGPGFWDTNALCSLAALNAVSSRRTPVLVSGEIDNMVPFAIHAGPHDAREVLSRYIPLAVIDGWVDDIVVNGRASHNTYAFWTPAELVGIISAGIATPGATLFASGTIEDQPFSFSARSVNDMQEQCLSFIGQTMGGAWIDDVSVNGTSRHNSSGWWSPSDVCMIVGSLASDRQE